HEFQKMLSNVDADKGAHDDGAGGVNEARAQFAQMLKKRHLAAVFGFLGTVRRDGIRHQRVSPEQSPSPESLARRWQPPESLAQAILVPGIRRENPPAVAGLLQVRRVQAWRVQARRSQLWRARLPAVPGRWGDKETLR